jgi:hypothetical protein
VKRVAIENVAPSELPASVERSLDHAAARLGLESVTLRVVEDEHLPKEFVAGVNDAGVILMRRSFLESESQWGLISTLFEELAHAKLHSLGLEEGLASFRGAFLHEFFANWFTFRELLAVDDRLGALFDDGPIPAGIDTPKFGYRLGAFVGAAAAGVEEAQLRVDQWLGGRVVDAATRRLVAHVFELGRTTPGARALAYETAALFESPTPR